MPIHLYVLIGFGMGLVVHRRVNKAHNLVIFVHLNLATILQEIMYRETKPMPVSSFLCHNTVILQGMQELIVIVRTN